MFVVTQMDLEADRYVRRLWITGPLDGEIVTAPRPFTAGPSDGRPRWSPDGSRVLFLRKLEGDDARPQVAVMSTDGGEAEILTDLECGVSEAEWSPDGSSIAIVASQWVAELADLDDEERSRRPRRVTRIPYRFDNRGWIHEKRSHVAVLDADATGPVEPRFITEGDWDDGSVAWSRDGSEIAFVSSRHPSRELDFANQVFSVPAGGGAATVRTPVGDWQTPGYDPAGVLHAVGNPGPLTVGISPLRRCHDLADLTSSIDRDVVPTTPTAPVGPQWLADGSCVFLLEEEGRVRACRLDGLLPGATLVTSDLIGGDRVIDGITLSADGSRAVFTATCPTDPGEVYWWDGSEERRITALNDAFRATTTLAEPLRFTIHHDDATIEGWVYLPDGDQPAPVLLNIHGGPATQYGYGFFDEFQVYAGAGYAVVATNPRGSAGYGAEHVAAVVGRWADELPPDLADVLAAVDTAAGTHPRLDTSRMGVMGGSYGGFMTVRVAAADDRYQSAVAERGLYAWDSFAGTSDIGMFFDILYLGHAWSDDVDAAREASPLDDAGGITAPTLVIHSETDYRTPIEQGERLFALLRRNGVETEMVRFPGEGHELSRSGTPKHRKERFEIILDWHDRHLGAT